MFFSPLCDDFNFYTLLSSDNTVSLMYCCGVAVLEIVWQVTTMFLTLDKIAKADPKYEDIMLLENYAAFQNRYCSNVAFRTLFHILFRQIS